MYAATLVEFKQPLVTCVFYVVYIYYGSYQGKGLDRMVNVLNTGSLAWWELK